MVKVVIGAMRGLLVRGAGFVGSKGLGQHRAEKEVADSSARSQGELTPSLPWLRRVTIRALYAVMSKVRNISNFNPNMPSIASRGPTF